MILEELRTHVLQTARLLPKYNLVWMAGGPVCARDPQTGYVVVTPSGLDYERLTPIDDEANIRHLIENEFQLEDFEVDTAPSGEEGLRMFEDQPYDVALLDLKLPKISGLETLKQLKKKSPGVEVIMITGYGESNQRWNPSS